LLTNGCEISPIPGLKVCYLFRTARDTIPYALNTTANLDEIGGVRHAVRYPFPTRIPPLRVCEPNEVLE
jgi:hypothetical protein